MLALELLRYAATDSASNPADELVSPLHEVDDRQIRWVIDGGWGPLLYRATRGNDDRVPAAWRDVLLSAELTAEIRHGNLIDTACEVIDACHDIATPVTLLKGISISDQYYPAAHLRPMADIDILVPVQACQSVESALLCRGYIRRPDYEPGEGAHHGVPLLHAERRVWVEVHTALFPEHEELLSDRLFRLSQLADQSIASTFHGKAVYRLTDELQLVYIAASWIRDLTLSKIHPSFVTSLLDAVYLLRASRQTLDWESLFGWLDNTMAMASLHVLLTYLSRHELVGLSSPPIISHLTASQNLVGGLGMRIIHATLDHYLLGGRSWNLALPPPVPGRYNVRHQLRKRWPTRRF